MGRFFPFYETLKRFIYEVMTRGITRMLFETPTTSNSTSRENSRLIKISTPTMSPFCNIYKPGDPQENVYVAPIHVFSSNDIIHRALLFSCASRDRIHLSRSVRSFLVGCKMLLRLKKQGRIIII
jgi:hypothetical protein